MKTKNFFVIAVLTPLLIDHAVTLYGQPAAYWVDHTQMNEAALITLLGFGPAAFIVGTVAYALIVMFLLLKLPMKYSLPLGIFAFVGHVWGSSSWIPEILESNNISVSYWLVSLGYFLILSIGLAIGIRKWLS
jgi:hypothetical protein